MRVNSRSAAGWRSGLSRQPHKLEITGSNPVAAIILVALMLLAILCAATARAQEPAVQTNLYAGTLASLEQDGAGTLHRGLDLTTLRLVIAMPLPAGVRLAARGDLTSLGALNPISLDLSSVRTVEGYGALSWSRKIAGIEVGPAAMAGALVALESVVAWRHQPSWGGGLRLGRAPRTWLYVLAGRDGASDAACCHRCCTSDDAPLTRAIVAGSLEFGRFALAGDFVSGQGGRVRVGALIRVPSLGGGQ